MVLTLYRKRKNMHLEKLSKGSFFSGSGRNTMSRVPEVSEQEYFVMLRVLSVPDSGLRGAVIG